ncbi:unnamed protein product [Arctia plantaginis]|uniref:Fucosyltransferase n=1 Tax=Arctia plantaginis TaxID=874455 RepID=A0A8S0YZC9_ARCPL|nr:unnamed protein product [Arctia plantaginis]
MQGYKSKTHDLYEWRFGDDLKYILVWTTENSTFEVQDGQGILLDHDCKDVNCYITTNKSLLNGRYEQFNAIVFHFGLLRQWLPRFLPKHRAPHQKYVFYSRLPSEDYPICSQTVDNYFNWTWSYKSASDIFNPFIEVRHINGTVVAPRSKVIWPKNSELSPAIFNNIDEVNTKTKAVMWLMSYCQPKATNLMSLKKLSTSLKDHDLSLDIYGCGNTPCPPGGCLELISRRYYFYLVFESSVTEDYLTEEVLMAYDNDAVPIIIGGGDCTKFLPDGSYISYQGLNEVQLAAIIAHTIKTPSKYREYFNWKSLYTINRVDQNKGFCKLCTLLNDYKKFASFSNYENFRHWWHHGPLRQKCLPKGAETYDEVLSYENISRAINVA